MRNNFVINFSDDSFLILRMKAEMSSCRLGANTVRCFESNQYLRTGDGLNICTGGPFDFTLDLACMFRSVIVAECLFLYLLMELFSLSHPASLLPCTWTRWVAHESSSQSKNPSKSHILWYTVLISISNDFGTEQILIFKKFLLIW